MSSSSRSISLEEELAQLFAQAITASFTHEMRIAALIKLRRKFEARAKPYFELPNSMEFAQKKALFLKGQESLKHAALIAEKIDGFVNDRRDPGFSVDANKEYDPLMALFIHVSNLKQIERFISRLVQNRLEFDTINEFPESKAELSKAEETIRNIEIVQGTLWQGLEQRVDKKIKGKAQEAAKKVKEAQANNPQEDKTIEGYKGDYVDLINSIAAYSSKAKEKIQRMRANLDIQNRIPIDLTVDEDVAAASSSSSSSTSQIQKNLQNKRKEPSVGQAQVASPANMADVNPPSPTLSEIFGEMNSLPMLPPSPSDQEAEDDSQKTIPLPPNKSQKISSSQEDVAANRAASPAPLRSPPSLSSHPSLLSPQLSAAPPNSPELSSAEYKAGSQQPSQISIYNLPPVSLTPPASQGHPRSQASSQRSEYNLPAESPTPPPFFAQGYVAPTLPSEENSQTRGIKFGGSQPQS